MLSTAKKWLPIGLMAMLVRDSYATAVDAHQEKYDHKLQDHYNRPISRQVTTTVAGVPTTLLSVVTDTFYETIVVSSTSTATLVGTTTVAVYETVPSTVVVSSTLTATTPTTETVLATATVPTTQIVYSTDTDTETVYTTDTDTETVYSTVPVTVTAYFTTTLYTTVTMSVTMPTTEVVTTTTTIPTTTTETMTVTSFPLRTSYTTLTVYDPCPSACSMSAGTVNLVYWPTDKPHSYPATWYDTQYDYTFTSPSVYYIIHTMAGTNGLTRTGPSAATTIWPFDLDEVSTLVLPGQTESRQLHLSDLGTDCPQSLPASVIATKSPEPHCDPILLAPSALREWAFPCNACGQFGLFDPPYAVPTLTGGLIGTTETTSTTTVVVPAPTTPTSAVPTVAPTTAPATPASPTNVPATSTRQAPSSTSTPAIVTAGASKVDGSAVSLITGLVMLVFALA